MSNPATLPGPVVQIEDVWKTYGTTPAVRGLNLSVPPQSVYGFLGPNGAGKSTTIRMMLGLQRPDRGTISLFGRPFEKERVSLLTRIGSLVESPSLYFHLTGRENLEVHRRLMGLPKRAIALPMLVLARQPHNIAEALLISSVLGLMVAAAGCWDFCWREVT